MLALGPGAQQAVALLAELSVQVTDEGERLVAEHILVATTLCVDDLDALVTPHGVPPTLGFCWKVTESIVIGRLWGSFT